MEIGIISSPMTCFSASFILYLIAPVKKSLEADLITLNTIGMKNILLLSLILAPVLCGIAGTNGNITAFAMDERSGGNSAPCLPCIINLTSAPGTDNQSLCINTAITNITYSTSAQVQGVTFSGLPAGVTGSYNSQAHVATISGTPAETGAYSYTVTASGTCTQAFRTGSIAVNPDATITLTSDPGTTNQTVCVNTQIAKITWFISGGGTGAGVTGLPTGVTGSYIPTVHTYQITGTPSTTGTFNYTVTTTGTCAQATATGSITVNPDGTIVLTSPPGSNSQAICVNTPIANITYSIGGSATGATATGLPPGVAGAYNAGAFTISGAPAGAGAFSYTVTTTGACPHSASGTITVNPDATIALTSDPGTTNQTVCINTPVANITYYISGGGTGAGVTGLPPGVTGAYNPTLHVYRIMGTPTAAGTFSYTVTTTGSCAQATATGSITVNPDGTIVLTSAPGSNSQAICENVPIANITYSIGGSATGVTIAGLPQNVGGLYNAGVLAIYGTPIETGYFPYSVTTTGTCAQATATGTLTVNPDATISLTSAPGTDNQTACTDAAITPITYEIGGGGNGAVVTGLPQGVVDTYLPTYHFLSIHGQPAVTGTFNYTVTTTGQCDQAIATGTIVIPPAATITLTSLPGTDNQIICLGDHITNITYLIGGGGLLGTLTGLPAGVNWGYQENILTLSGSPTETGTFNFTVTTNGTTCEGTAMGTITVHPVPTIECYWGDRCDQEVCINTPIDDIGFVIGGAATGAYVVGLPPGVTGMYLFDYFVIGGTPSEAGLFTYAVTVTGTYCNTSYIGYIWVQAPQLPILVSAPGTDNQSVCRNNHIVPIDYLIENYTERIEIWLHRAPAGVTHTVTGGHVMITGQPSSPPGTYTYDLVVDDVCGFHMASGTITVFPDANITLVSGSADQSICLGDSLTPVIYSISELATGVNVTGLPPGVDYFYSTSINRLTLFGAPAIAGSYPYLIHATTPECEDTETGTISADSIATITLISAPGTDNQVVCYDTPITEIIYKIGSSNNAWAHSLPLGVGADYYPSDHTLKIAGRPQSNGSFTYHVWVEMNSCGFEEQVHGNIEVIGGPMHISGPRCVRIDSAGNVYSTEPGMTNYEWNVSAGGIITAGGTSTDHTVTVTWNAIGNQYVNVSGTWPNGCGQGQGTASPYLVWVLELPTLLNVGNIIVENGQDHCALAAQTLTVAGNGTTYLVQNGGFARFMAGQNIVFLPGFKVEPGGAIEGFIVSYCHYYCNPPYKTGIMPGEHLAVQDTLSPISETPFFFAVYPNPTSGSFTLELNPAAAGNDALMRCFNLLGTVVLEKKLPPGTKHDLSLPGYPAGIYLVRVTSGNRTALMKLILQ